MADVTGVGVAERLAAGEITLRDVVSLHRFFALQAKPWLAEMQRGCDASRSALCRSWDLRGGDPARAWSGRLYQQSVESNEIIEDPYQEMLRAGPDQLYAMFGAGAWRWEFGLDTIDKAARFVEDYHRATGHILDLQRAFGSSGPNVALAMVRRTTKPDPIFRGRTIGESHPVPAVAEAARADVADLLEAMAAGPLLHVLPQAGARLSRACTSWPEWVAACALGEARAPASVVSPRVRRPLPLHEYEGAERLYYTFFHPGGSAYVDDAGTDSEGIGDEVAGWLNSPLPDRAQTMDLCERMLDWLRSTNRLACLSRTYLEAWRAGDLSLLAEALPVGSDLLPAIRAMPAPETVPSVDEPKYRVGDVVQVMTAFGASAPAPVVVGLRDTVSLVVAVNDDATVEIVRLSPASPEHPTPEAHPASVSLTVLRRGVDLAKACAALRGEDGDLSGLLSIVDLLLVEDQSANVVSLEAPPDSLGRIGDRIQVGGAQACLLGVMPGTIPSVPVPVVAMAPEGDSRYVDIIVLPYELVRLRSSYLPRVTPEPHGYDGVDDEQGQHRLVGTPMAFEFAARAGATMTAEPMKLRLGARYVFRAGTRTVIGFARSDDTPGYVLVSENGNLSWKSAARADRELSGKPHYLQSIIQSALPLPEDAVKAKIHVGYTVPKHVRGRGFNFTVSPIGRLFNVGTRLLLPSGEAARLVGWSTQASARPRAVLLFGEGDFAEYRGVEPLEAGLLEWSSKRATIAYRGETADDGDVITLSRRDGATRVSVVGDGVSFPSPIESLRTDPVDEPVFEWLPQAAPVIGAVIGVLPPGTRITNGTKTEALPGYAIVLTAPVADGYDLAIPGAYLEVFDPTVRTTIENVHAETGLAMRPLWHVGDFPAGLTVARVYAAEVVGGDPQRVMPIGPRRESADSVVLARLDTGDAIGRHPWTERSWYRRLLLQDADPWQQRAVNALARQLAAVSWPPGPSEGKYHSRVTGPQDSPFGRPIPALQVMPDGSRGKDMAVFVVGAGVATVRS